MSEQLTGQQVTDEGKVVGQPDSVWGEEELRERETRDDWFRTDQYGNTWWTRSTECDNSFWSTYSPGYND